jgi:hypothetical protein
MYMEIEGPFCVWRSPYASTEVHYEKGFATLVPDTALAMPCTQGVVTTSLCACLHFREWPQLPG